MTKEETRRGAESVAGPLKKRKRDGLAGGDRKGKRKAVIGPGNAYARMPAFLAIISANFTKLLHLELSETDDCR